MITDIRECLADDKVFNYNFDITTRQYIDEPKFRNGLLYSAKWQDKKIKITKDTIVVEGYKEWVSVGYMTTNKDRLHCVSHVIGLIIQGKL